MILNVATILTISRIIFIPGIAFCYIYNNGELRNLAAFIFLLALVTDYFDGLIARKFNQETPFGAFPNISSVEKYTNFSRLLFSFAKFNKLTVPTTLSLTNSIGYFIDLST